MIEENKESTSKKQKLEKGKELEIVGETAEKKVNQKLPEKKIPQLTFDAWWVRSQKVYNFGADMKEVIFKHFRARGFLKNKKFDEGLNDFGIKS